MQTNSDFRDLFAALNAAEAEYLFEAVWPARMVDPADVEVLEKDPGDRP